MYHALLTNRYLVSRVIPLIAVAAVALCVALVIIVVSVMTGFLDMVRTAGRALMGDVVVSCPVMGIPYYEDLIAEIDRLPEAEAASALVDSWGMLRMPYPDGSEKESKPVQVWGIDGDFARVTGYRDALHWRAVGPEQRRWLFADLLVRDAPRLADLLDPARKRALVKEVLERSEPGAADGISDAEHDARIAEFTDDDWVQVTWMLRFDEPAVERLLGPELFRELIAGDPRLVDPDRMIEDGLTLVDPVKGDPAMVTGLHVSIGNVRQGDGEVKAERDWFWWMPRHEVTLTMVPADAGVSGSLRAESHIFPVVNEFRSGVFLIDDKRVIIPIAIAQRMLGLDAGTIYDDDGERIGEDPARATVILVRAADGVTPEALKSAVSAAYDRFYDAVRADPSRDRTRLPLQGPGLNVMTWEEQQASFIGPIEKERELMRTLFSLVYLVCAGLVLSIFWAIVYEKTRDIGILRSIGASRAGISWIFLRYGLVVGVCGAIAGLGLSKLIVHNINAIHTALGDPPKVLGYVLLTLAAAFAVATVVRSVSGRLLPRILGSLVTIVTAGLGLVVLNMPSIVVWDPRIYYFATIPNAVDVGSAAITMVGAVVFSLLGAFIPAAKAADVDPVQALRYE